MQQRIVELAPEVWGEEGRDTWRALNNLAGTVAAEGDLAGARELLESAIAAMTRLWGEEDGDCLAAMGNLAAVLWQMGEREEAYWLQQQVVETRRRVSGDDDPATRAAVAAFDVMQRDSGF
jgi:ATP/maltotriose-dependent transcriptional regulator MalT